MYRQVSISLSSLVLHRSDGDVHNSSVMLTSATMRVDLKIDGGIHQLSGSCYFHYSFVSSSSSFYV